MFVQSKKQKKVKVLGYPFAGGQGQNGVENTPAWILRQPWFQDMLSTGNVVYEQIDVTSTHCNKFHEKTSTIASTSSDSGENEIQDSSSKTFVQPKNASNVFESALRL